MKKLTGVLIPLITIIQISQIALASFSDVNSDHKNYDAILYLQENKIINGYENGTFKPESDVNRAEFLKIILEGTYIPLDKENTTLPFPDTDENEWYAPYIKKAYAEGWVVGYTDKTFKPDQTINKAEALKILGEVQKWPLEEVTEMPYKDTPKLAWYTKYVSYGKNHEYLEETGDYFTPKQLMTRANISEIIYRTLTIENNEIFIGEKTISETNPNENQDNKFEDNPADNEETMEEMNFTPVKEGSVSTGFFDKINLDEPLPNTFYKNEVYVIEGEVISGSHDKVSALLSPYEKNTFTTYATNVENNHFSLPVYFKESGNYQIGILPGESGETKIEKISILPNLPKSSNAETLTSNATSLSVDYADDITFVKYNAPESTIKKLFFKQDDKIVKYISRQNIDTIKVSYSDFKNFKEDKVQYYIKTAKISSKNPLKISSDFTVSKTNSFTAVEHSFDSILKESISANIPDKKSENKNISFIGTVKVDTQQSAYVIKPNGLVEDVTLSTSESLNTYLETPIIPKNGDFQFSYTLGSKGRYIIEIVDKNGLPIVNHPIYVGNIIPLIPDYFDLNVRNYFNDEFNIDELRQDLLNQINKSRKEFGLSEVSMPDELNNLAQGHSNDMVENNFFGHVNPSNETPEDRRINLGIKTAVSENIARDTSIEFAHLGLMRSAAHRKNILTADWERVGLGIALKDGYLFITEEFSTNEITSNDLQNYKTELFEEINNKREKSNIQTLTYNPALESACAYLNEKTIQEKTNLTTENLEEALEIYEIKGTSKYIGRTYNIWSEMLSSILREESTIEEPIWDEVGIDIQADQTGIIHATFMINHQ